MKNIIILLVVTQLIFFSSCEKLVDAGPPEDLLISSTVFKSNETATSATTGIYATIMKPEYPMPYNIAFMTGVYGDELSYPNSDQGVVSLYKNDLLSKDALTNQIWTNGFNYIYQANAIIESLERSPDISANVKSQLKGEALFIRSFWNYYLSALYGPIPLITSTDYLRNSKLTRASVEAIHSQIINDLLITKNLLSDKYVGRNSISETTDRVRPNTFTASALLSRVYLQMKNYTKANEEATRIISNSIYDLADLISVFKRDSREVIWQLELPTNVYGYTNSFEASLFALTSKPTPAGSQRCATVSVGLQKLFASKDNRKSTWMGTYTDNSVTPAISYVFPRKYRSQSTLADEYTTVFRLSEQYLIRAEALTNLGFTADAINDVDRIRGRAGLDLLKNITPSIGKGPLLDSIANERRREFFCEWGLRWLDIKRSNQTEQLLEAIAIEKGSQWKATAIYWPIPLNDVLNSVNQIGQNEGYN